MKTLFDVDPLTGAQTFFHSDVDGEGFVLEKKQDITACVELSQAEFNSVNENAPWRDITKVASVPLSEVDELMRVGIWYDDRALMRWIQDRDHSKFRTRPGRVA